METGNTEYLTPAEAAALWRVEPHTVNRWAAEGRLPPGTAIRTPGGQWRFKASAMRALLGHQGETVLCAGGQHHLCPGGAACTCPCHRAAEGGTRS